MGSSVLVFFLWLPRATSGARWSGAGGMWGEGNSGVFGNKKCHKHPKKCPLHRLLGAQLNPTLPALPALRDAAFRIWGSRVFSQLYFPPFPAPNPHFPPQTPRPGRAGLSCAASFELKALFPCSPSLPPRVAAPRGQPRRRLGTKAGRDSRRGEENRGIQAGEPRDVQLGDPGPAAQGRPLRPQHGALR